MDTTSRYKDIKLTGAGTPDGNTQHGHDPFLVAFVVKCRVRTAGSHGADGIAVLKEADGGGRGRRCCGHRAGATTHCIDTLTTG